MAMEENLWESFPGLWLPASPVVCLSRSPQFPQLVIVAPSHASHHSRGLLLTITYYSV